MVPNMHSCHVCSSSSDNRRVGWRFKPTKAELLEHYLEKKNEDHLFSVQFIPECDIYKFNPDELACEFQVGGEDMYFFTQLNRKYEGGSRADRRAGNGFWVSTDGHTIFDDQGKTLGYKRNLKFYMGKKPKVEKTKWLMKEYRIYKVDPPTMKTTSEAGRGKRKRVAATRDDHQKKMNGFVLCRIYETGAKKTNEATINEVIAEDPTSYPVHCYEDQPNIINYECLPPLTLPAQCTPGYTFEDMFGNPLANIPLVVDTPSVDLNANFPYYEQPSTSSWCMPHYDLDSNLLFSNVL